ncbi:MAG: hypothetical protein NTX28_01105, partial [Novosphingobium sp.]|nr:hypothetical protein [Novosphingobium sp.]
NMRDPNLQLDPTQSLAENNRRIGLLKQFAQEEQNLITEMNSRGKVLEQKASSDLVQLRRERQDKILTIARDQAEGELNLLRARENALMGARDNALTGQDEAGRLRVEQNFQNAALDMARQRIETERGIRAGTLKQQLIKDLQDAETLGDKRGAAEKAARSRYASELQASELQATTEWQTAQLDAVKRINEARAAVVSSSIDRELAGINEIEGAQLAALQRRYAREKELAARRGDTQSVTAYQGGLDKITDEAKSRTVDARKLIADADKEVGSLNEKLDDLAGKAAKGVEGARIAAAKPFDSLIEGVRKQISDLNKARTMLVGSDPKLVADIDRRVRSLNSFIQQATAERTKAVAKAENDSAQAARDKAVKAAAQVAEKLYAGGEGDKAAYLAALNTERIYWTTRLKGLEEGSQEYEQAQARIVEIGEKARAARLVRADVPLTEAKNQLALLTEQEKLARTEAQRNELARKRMALLERITTLEGKRIANPDLTPSQAQAQVVSAAQAAVTASEARLKLADVPLMEARN